MGCRESKEEKRIKIELLDVLGNTHNFFLRHEELTENWLLKHFGSTTNLKAVPVNVAQELLYRPNTAAPRNRLATALVADKVITGNALLVPRNTVFSMEPPKKTEAIF